MYTKEEIKETYYNVSKLLLERTKELINNDYINEPLEKVHKIQSDIQYFFNKTERDIKDSLQTELNKYSNPHIRHENQM